MSSSSTSLAASTDHSFFSTLKFSSSGSSTLVTTRVVAVPGPQDPRAGAPTIKVTAQEVLSSTPSRDLDALNKRKSTDGFARNTAKKRRVSPPQDEPTDPRTRASRTSPIASGSSRYSSRASSLLSVDSASTPSTRATSVASVPPVPPPRECWIDEKGDPGDGFLSSEAVVRNLMRGYKRCECPNALFFTLYDFLSWHGMFKFASRGLRMQTMAQWTRAILRKVIRTAGFLRCL